MIIYEQIKKLAIQFFVLKDYIIQLIKYRKYRQAKDGLDQTTVLDTYKSIDYIIENGCSLCRYGDGEFLMVWQYTTGDKYMNDLYFQQYNPELGRRLAEILSSNNKNCHCCIGIPYSYIHGVKGLVFEARRFLMFFCNKYHNLINSTIDKRREYLNSEMTRYYITRKDKKESHNIVHSLKKIWEGRDICFIEGDKSRLGVGNDLFENSKSITRILCPSENAFDSYDSILKTVKIIPKDTLCIIALGMAATVLAYDMSLMGYQALDLGHIDIEYEWMRMGVHKKIAIPHKYTNEAEQGKNPEDIKDLEYLNQIIARIGC